MVIRKAVIAQFTKLSIPSLANNRWVLGTFGKHLNIWITPVKHTPTSMLLPPLDSCTLEDYVNIFFHPITFTMVSLYIELMSIDPLDNCG